MFFTSSQRIKIITRNLLAIRDDLQTKTNAKKHFQESPGLARTEKFWSVLIFHSIDERFHFDRQLISFHFKSSFRLIKDSPLFWVSNAKIVSRITFARTSQEVLLCSTLIEEHELEARLNVSAARGKLKRRNSLLQPAQCSRLFSSVFFPHFFLAHETKQLLIQVVRQ